MYALEVVDAEGGPTLGSVTLSGLRLRLMGGLDATTDTAVITAQAISENI
jgi:hypothetical protein